MGSGQALTRSAIWPWKSHLYLCAFVSPLIFSVRPGRICRSRATAPYQVWICCLGLTNHLQRAPGIVTRRQMVVLSPHIHKKAEKPQYQGKIPTAKIFQSENAIRELHWSCELDSGLINHCNTNWREGGKGKLSSYLPYRNGCWP